jgi:hypothetical protein
MKHRIPNISAFGTWNPSIPNRALPKIAKPATPAIPSKR